MLLKRLSCLQCQWGCGLLLALLLGACTTPPVDGDKDVTSPQGATSTAETACPPPGPLPECRADAQSVSNAALTVLLEDLARYPTLKREEARRLQSTLEETTKGGDEKGNRVRLAVLLSLQKTSQSDQKAIALLEQAIKNKETPPGQRNVASALLTQIQERQAVWQKLEALLNVDRKILGDRLPGAKVGKPSSPTQKPKTP